MGSINLYRIEAEKRQEFLRDLSNKMNPDETREIEYEISKETTETVGFTLYISRPQQKKNLSWNWVLKEFDKQPVDVDPSLKAVVLVEKEDDTTYAITFGQSFFLVDKYCDRDFGFAFARKISFQEIKTTTLTTPSSHRNRTINTYINYNELEFDSGESFAKLKAKADLPDDFTLFKPALEIGNSIRFTVQDDSLENVMNVIFYIEKILKTEKDRYRIPVFSKITDKEYILKLNKLMEDEVSKKPEIHISELDIIGVAEVFNHNDSEFILKNDGKKKTVVSLSSQELKDFCSENNWSYGQTVLDIKVVSLCDGEPVATKSVREMIDYTDDGERCMLSKGVWYKYNDDYLSYLKDSISEISAEYHPEYDFTKAIHEEFINAMFDIEKDLPKYLGESDKKVKKSLEYKYYAERAFNILRQQEDGFRNFDREEDRVGNADIEKMDLYKDGQMFAVKIGNSSGKLCYAVDQSLTSLKLYKHNKLQNMPDINTVCVWIVLERKKHIEDTNGKPNINSLDMLMLKNKLDQWKKEVRLQGLRPLIYINYRSE